MVMLKKKSKGKKISFIVSDYNFEKWEELKKRIESLGYEVEIDKELEKSFKKILGKLEQELQQEQKKKKDNKNETKIDTFETESIT